ncbi:hypothetical protein PPYR_06714 [Photinus pyralis]|uniref:Sensory neuron membrane protein 2 n=1 Tax=Photinus pyralis TaxID=7054 RepID=A0A5N4ANF5_PHOPY|nr:sensory neuron membrane protein 2-like [Photinus pyralis]XP_031343690.1 sensory neuron membrane protein 2-like [Photinus pyralis]KAB0797701.1 hypothetical protein PPYR_08694 [Photinus pyralis]KAB0798834.1 hypothetical protein PPYR_06714 [Photinus pyralis]
MRKNCPVIVAGSGFVVLFTGIISSWYVFPAIVGYAISERIALKEGNEVYEIWRKQPFPQKMKIYFFNVTNADDVQQGAAPVLKEVGPYVYDEYWERVDITIDDGTDTIKYMLKRSFFFNQKESGCRMEDDPITMVNGALVSTALQVYAILPSAIAMVNDAVPYLYKGAKDVFIRAPAKDILFDGILITCHDPEVEFICSAMKGMLPPTIEFTNGGTDFKFSLFGYMNKTLAGPFVIGRGLKNTTRGDILLYRESNSSLVWPGPGCNKINGSDSTLFYPLKTPPERIYAYSPDICRSMFVSFEKYVDYEGIPTWKYSNRPESIIKNSENECFCPLAKNEDYNDVTNCPENGLVDLTFCLKAPILVSNPHFYLGDSSLTEFARGVNPVKELHENFMYLEPITGNPVAGAKRLQMNVRLKRFEDFELLNNVSEGVFPMVWLEEGALIPPEYRKMMSAGLSQLAMLDVIKWIFILTGILLMVLSFVLVMYKERLMCFANSAFGNKVSITDVKSHSRAGFADPVTEINFNNTSMYPSLYPQVNEQKFNDRVVRRNNANPTIFHVTN